MSEMATAGMRQLREAAQAGQREAQLLLAQASMEGRGLQADPDEAFHWYSVAANLGEPMAQMPLDLYIPPDAMAVIGSGRRRLQRSFRVEGGAMTICPARASFLGASETSRKAPRSTPCSS